MKLLLIETLITINITIILMYDTRQIKYDANNYPTGAFGGTQYIKALKYFVCISFIYHVCVCVQSVSLALLHCGRSQFSSSNRWVLRLNSDFRLVGKHPYLVISLSRLSSVITGKFKQQEQ